jgi:hypothetical protein
MMLLFAVDISEATWAGAVITALTFAMMIYRELRADVRAKRHSDDVVQSVSQEMCVKTAEIKEKVKDQTATQTQELKNAVKTVEKKADVIVEQTNGVLEEKMEKAAEKAVAKMLTDTTVLDAFVKKLEELNMKG